MRFVLLSLAVCAVFACSGPKSDVSAQEASVVVGLAAPWSVDQKASSVRFTASQSGEAFEGAFSDFDAVIIFDPDQLADASIEATIRMASVQTGDDERDSSLPASDWFKVKKFPVANFQSQQVNQVGSGAYEALGQLTIRDVTREVILPFTLEITEGVAHAQGELSVLRTDYDVGKGAFSSGKWVGLDVTVQIDIMATKP